MAIPNLPIPGQSLTAEPKAAPYERPPQIVDPKKALDWHLDRLADEERQEVMVDIFELGGMDVVTFTEGTLRAAVLDGRHSIDVSMIIAPVIHEFICTVLDAAGVEYDEGFEDDSQEREQIKYLKANRKAKKLLAEHKKTGNITSDVEEEPAEEPKPKRGKGLMAPKSDRMKQLEGDME